MKLQLAAYAETPEVMHIVALRTRPSAMLLLPRPSWQRVNNRALWQLLELSCAVGRQRRRTRGDSSAKTGVTHGARRERGVCGALAPADGSSGLRFSPPPEKTPLCALLMSKLGGEGVVAGNCVSRRTLKGRPWCLAHTQEARCQRSSSQASPRALLWWLSLLLSRFRSSPAAA